MRKSFSLQEFEILTGIDEWEGQVDFPDKNDWEYVVCDAGETDLKDCWQYEQWVFKHVPTDTFYAINPIFIAYEGYAASTEADLTLYEVEPYSVIKYRAKYEKL